ncbi:hypothetical protein [Treponema denticola]|uniref:MuF-C-terminal domain-containing protein n=1 Tax=Treponema denticola TaxID=158 RepID=UPI0020A25516|nr:hypothetical protein [Treponema denticola]UTC93074.1 hypothetical protein E4N84_08205 [Treponema denticola]
MSDFNDIILGQNQGRRGQTTYHYLDFGQPNTVFDNNRFEKKNTDLSFLSSQNQIREIEEREKKRKKNQDRYLINLSDGEYEILNAAIANSEIPEDEAYRFASAYKYSKQFNMPLSYTYEHLEDLNNWWLGPVKKTPQSAFTSIVNSFALGNNTVKLGGLGAQLLKAEHNGDVKEIQRLQNEIKEIEEDNEYLKDDMPRTWFTKLLQSGAQTIPFSAHVFIPSALGSIIAPGIGTAAGFARSMEMQTGLEYLDLKKAGVKADLAKKMAIMSGGLQAAIEVSLGNVASITGKGLGADKIVSKMITRLNAKGTMGHIAKGLMHYGVDTFSEGVEEAVQELVSAGTKELAAVLQGEGVETDDAWTIAGNVWESFKGGMAGSLVLGVPGAVKFTKANVQEANNIKKSAIVNPSKEDFIRKNKDNAMFEGMTEADKKENLSSIYEAQKESRESFQKAKIDDYDEWLHHNARIEGEVMRDKDGEIIYETDEEGNIIKEKDENGEEQPVPKRWGKASDVVRHGDRLYITEGQKHEKTNGNIEGEYIVGDPTQETEYNDYGHIYYSFDKEKNTVTIKNVRVQSDEYQGIIKEFVRDFGEKFNGAKIEWNPKGETLQKIKAELIAENPNGKENGLQYFTENSPEEVRENIKLTERLKETMPNLTDEERHTATVIFDALAKGAGMDAQTYLDTYYSDEILTNTPPADLEKIAAQEEVDTKDIKGAAAFKEMQGDIKALVYVGKKADFSTFVHEAAHVARKTLNGDLLIQAESAFDVKDGKWTRAQEEEFAQGFEQYLKEGVAPTEELKNIFQKAAEFLSRIYKNLKEIIGINDDIRKVYDELLGKDNSTLKQAEERIDNENESNSVFIKNILSSVDAVKQALEGVKNTDIKNKETGIIARLSSTGINKMTSNKAVEKSEANGFTRKEHYGAVAEIKVLYEKAKLLNTHTDIKNERSNIVSIKRFTAALTLSDGKSGEALITLKETEEHGHRIYSLELDEIIKPEQRWEAENDKSQRWETAKNSGTPTAQADSSITENIEAVNTEKTEKGKINEAYEKATQAAREAMQNSIKAAEERKEDIRLNGAQYEAETIEYYKKNFPGLDGEAIKAKIQEDAKSAHTSYEEFTANRALEQRRLNDMGDMLFQTEPVTQEEIDFKENADEYRKGIDKYFNGNLKGNEVLTVTKRTPAILRAVGFEDKPITVTGAVLKHITDKHKDITQAILKTLPEQLLDPIAVFKSQNESQPNSRLIFTEHIIDGKPVIAAIEMNYEDKHGTINSIRSVYERDIIAKSGWNTLQGWIDNGNLLYVDDKRADEWSAITGVSFPLEAFSKLNPSNSIIGENAGNVNTGVLKKSDIIGDNPQAIYFQTEAETYKEIAEASESGGEETAREHLESIVIGESPSEAYRFLYADNEERAKADKAYRDSLTPELEKALQKDLKDENIKNDTFIKMMENREAMREFMKAYIKAENQGFTELKDLMQSSGGAFSTIAYQITNGKPLTEKQHTIALNYIKEDLQGFRNIFAELNGFSALRSLTEKEKAWTETYAKAVSENHTEEKQARKSRAEIQDEMFIEEIEDVQKVEELVKEAANIYYFDFDNFKPADEQEADYRDDLKRKQSRINREMKNHAWKSQMANAFRGKDFSKNSIKNIQGQMRNNPRSYRSLYADIMGREDMKVKDAETTDSIIKTKLKSRPDIGVKLDELKLENMSPAEKQQLIKVIDDKEMEDRINKGTITSEDIKQIEGLIQEKNKNIKELEKQIAELKEDSAYDSRIIHNLEEQLKNERINRKVLTDTVKARDVALKAVMKRVNLKVCNAEEAEALAAVQMFLKKDVQKALNATIDKDDPRIREAYALWSTSQEYRQTLGRMLGNKKGWETLRNLLENKPIGEWTADDRKLAQRLIPARNKFFSLGIYNRTEKNFLDMRTEDLTDEQIEKLASTVLPETMLAKLKHQPLSQWTVDELIDLAKVIEKTYREGRQKYSAKKATEKFEAYLIRNMGIKNFIHKKGFDEKAATWSDAEKQKKGGLQALRRKLKYAAMRPYAFIEMLDGGSRGVLYDLLEFEQRECYNRFKAGMDTRLSHFNEFMEKNGLKVADLEKKILFENFYVGKNKKDLTLSVSEIIGAYLASFDEKSRAAVQYGNFAEQDERDIAKQSNSYGALDSFSEMRYGRVLEKAEELIRSDERIKSFVDYLRKEYKAEGIRLKDHNRTVNNIITEIRDDYFPMLRLDVSGEEDARKVQKKIVGEHATGTKHGIEKGQTKARIDIGKGNQSPIKLNAVNTFLESVEANERLYAYDKYAQKLNRVIKGYDSKQFRRTLETAYGNEALRYLDKQVNTIVDPTAGRVYSDTDKMLRMLRGNTAAAYLGWKMSGIIKQGLTSPAPFMQYVNPVNYAKAALDLTIHNKEMMEFIHSRSKLMQDRSFDMMQGIVDELAKEAKTKGGKAITKIQQKGMEGLEWIDRACVAPGWLAAFREEEGRLRKANTSLEKPLTDLEIDLKATQWADDVLVRTQPSGRAEELAPLFREGGEALRMLLQFQSSLNVIYNNIRHDLPNAIKNKQYARAAGIITGYALAGFAVGAITEGFGDDDDDTSDKVRKGVYYAFTQYTDSVPIINGIVDGVAEKLITGKTSYKGSSSLYTTVEKAAQGSIALSDGDFKKAAGKYAEAAALSLGLPTSGSKEVFYAAEQLFNGEWPSALWGRRK